MKLVPIASALLQQLNTKLDDLLQRDCTTGKGNYREVCASFTCIPHNLDDSFD